MLFLKIKKKKLKNLLLALIFLFLPHFLLHNEVHNACDDQGDDHNLDVLGIFADLLIQLVFGNDGMQIPSHRCKDAMPPAGSNGGEQDKLTIIHTGEPCGDRDQMTDYRHESTCQSGYNTMIVKIFLASVLLPLAF